MGVRAATRNDSVLRACPKGKTVNSRPGAPGRKPIPKIDPGPKGADYPCMNRLSNLGWGQPLAGLNILGWVYYP